MNSKNIENLPLNALSLDELKIITNNKWHYYKLYENADKVIKKYENIIYQKCKHEWQCDYTASGMYDGPDKICKKCNLYQNNYMYN